MTNTEKYKTMEERSEAFGDHCRVQPDCESCPVYIMICKQKKRIQNAFERIQCGFAWLELEAKEDTWKNEEEHNEKQE